MRNERLPSVKTLSRIEGINRDPSTPRKLRKVLERDLALRVRLGIADGIIGGTGVETISAGHNQRSPAIHYVNLGDTYSTTLMLINGRFIVGCWGDIVERGNYD